MIIQKFGGTSVGSPQRIRELAEITNDDAIKLVVLSAVAGTTNKLADIASVVKNGYLSQALNRIYELRKEYEHFINELLPQKEFLLQGKQIIETAFSLIESLSISSFNPEHEKIILAQGEIISTNLYHIYLNSIGKNSMLINALDFMNTNANGEPDMDVIRKNLNKILDDCSDKSYIITQGYICRNHKGEVDNLQRGGSDYTATILGAALFAKEIQIWTDIDGLHNNDPRLVSNTQAVRKISYREAAELAYFGAKILHPTCILPAEAEDIPVRLKYTFDPSAIGTYISNESSGKTITAIAAKDNITYIRIRSGRMINAYGFLRKVFEVFEKYQTPIDMITTSEVSVSLTIDNNDRLSEIVEELQCYGEIIFEKHHSIICIVGDKLVQEPDILSTILSAFSEIPVDMISYGGSVNNISVLIDTIYKESALNTLHNVLFEEQILI